jgi:hypothetical protein
MKVNVGPALLKNIFIILDGNNDNEISLDEFSAIFSKYMPLAN